MALVATQREQLRSLLLPGPTPTKESLGAALDRLDAEGPISLRHGAHLLLLSGVEVERVDLAAGGGTVTLRVDHLLAYADPAYVLTNP